MGTKKPSKKGNDSKKKGSKKPSKADALPVEAVDTSAVQQETPAPAVPVESAEPDVGEGQTSEGEPAVQETPAVEVEKPEPMESPEPSPTSDEPTPTAVTCGPVRDPRLPPVGSTITRTFKGRMLEVLVTETGFEFEGEIFSSISALAKHITGHTAVNGWVWFRLGVTAGGAGATRQAARLAGKIRKLDGLTVKMRAALAQGALALADAEAEIAEMHKKVEELQQDQ